MNFFSSLTLFEFLRGRPSRFVVKCEEAPHSPQRDTAGNGGGSHFVAMQPRMCSMEAFPEHTHKIPLHPQMDEDYQYNVYQWGNEAVPMSRRGGGRLHSEESDNRFHQAMKFPWPSSQTPFHPNEHPENDRLNTQYSNMITDRLPEGGFSDKPYFSRSWEKLLAYHHGLYRPQVHQELKSADDIRLSVSEYSDRVNADDSLDACKYLAVERFSCYQVHQGELDPRGATTKCMKWDLEFDRCLWDQEKFNRGYSYIEPRAHKKHRAYVGAPDYQFS